MSAWPFNVRLNGGDLARRKAEAIALDREFSSAFPGFDPGAYTPPAFTCESCASRFECDLAFDLYNTDGDCLASK